MLLSTVLAALLAGTSLVEAVPTKRAVGDPVPVDYLGIVNTYKSYVNSTLSAKDSKKGRNVCNHKSVTVRKEWRSMSADDRKKYISAVKCMVKHKTQANKRKVPGARNRLDDFVASHLIEGDKIHFNGYLFAWHRHFVWLYEQTLRDECDYKGAQPYWDWALDADNILASPVFDGSETSMGNNGEFFPHGNTTLQAFGLNLSLPPGTGGGCLKPGPFSDLIVNLGINQTIGPPDTNVTAPFPKTVQNQDTTAVEPLSTPAQNNITSPVDPTFEETQEYAPVGLIKFNEALNYNPRCLKRDLNLGWASQLGVSFVEYLLSSNNADQLEKRVDGWDGNDSNQPRMHPAGHFSVGGLQNDPFASPGDPVFFLIHAQIDRLYTMWQAQDPANRLYQVGGTNKAFDFDSTGTPVTVDDKLSFGIVDGKRKLKNLLSPTDKYYCYSYE